MTLKPLGDRVLIRPDVPSSVTASGLLKVEHRKPEQLGTVLAIGTMAHPRKADAEALAKDIQAHGYSPQAADLIRSLVHREPLCAVGDRVLFSWQSGQELLDDDGERLFIMLERDILAVIGPGVAIEANEPILA
jgi:co-chaperonin GroES (HSP10)